LVADAFREGAFRFGVDRLALAASVAAAALAAPGLWPSLAADTFFRDRLTFGAAGFRVSAFSSASSRSAVCQ
jgi:hypothetical protein